MTTWDLTGSDVCTLLKEGAPSPFLISPFLLTRMERLAWAIVDHVDKRWLEPPDKRNLVP